MEPTTSTTSTVVGPIAVGTTWSVLGNRSIGSMSLFTDADGAVSGSLFGDTASGFWHEESATLTLMRAPADSRNLGHQLYRAHRFTVTTPTGQMDVLAGSFEAFAETGARPDAHRFGWFGVRRGSTIDPTQPEPGEHLWTQLRTVLPDEDDIAIGVTGGHHLVVVGNGHVGPLYLAKLPSTAPGDSIWGDIFTNTDAGQPGSANVRGFERIAPGGATPHGDLVFVRGTHHAITPADDLQVYRGHRVRAAVPGRGTIDGWAGSFTALAGTGATAGHTEFGWFAIRT